MATGLKLPNGERTFTQFVWSYSSHGWWSGMYYNTYSAYAHGNYLVNYTIKSGLSPGALGSPGVGTILSAWIDSGGWTGAGSISSATYWTLTANIETTGASSSSTKGGTLTVGGDSGRYWDGDRATVKAKANTGFVLTELTGYSGTTPTKSEAVVTTIVNSDQIYTAKFQKVYNIVYAANGGDRNSVPTDTADHFYNSGTAADNVTIPLTKPTRAGYTFLGWSTYSSAKTASYTPGNTYANLTSGNSITLSAVWAQYSVTFYDGDTKLSITPLAGAAGDEVVLPAYNAATKDGYSIAAWTIGQNNYAQNSKYALSNANVNATAVWVSIKLRKRGTGADAETNVNAIGSLYLLSSEDGYDQHIEPTVGETDSDGNPTAWLFAPKPNTTYRVGCMMATTGNDRLWEFSGITGTTGETVSEIVVGPTLGNLVFNANFTRKVQKKVGTGVEMLRGEDFDGMTFPDIAMSITSPSEPDTQEGNKYILGTPIVATPDYDGAVGWKLYGFRLDYYNDNDELLYSSDVFSDSQFIAGDKVNVPSENFTENMKIVGIFARKRFKATKKVDEPSRIAIANNGFKAIVLDPIERTWTSEIDYPSRNGEVRYGEKIRLKLESGVADGYSLDGLYANGEKIASAIPSAGYVEYTVVGGVDFVAKAAVSVNMALEYYDNVPGEHQQPAHTCSISVNGVAAESHSLTVVLGDTISYSVILGNHTAILGGMWWFDAWYAASDAEHADPFDMPVEDAAFAPTAALDIKARVSSQVIVNTFTVEFKTVDADETKTHIDAEEDWLTSNPSSKAKDVDGEVGNKKIVLTYEGTKPVTLDFVQAVMSGLKTFAFSKVVRIAAGGDEIDLSSDPTFGILTNRTLNLIAYYSEGGNREIRVAFARDSEERLGMGTVEIVAVSGEGATIAEDGRSATAPSGGTVTFRANQNNGYAFAGWYYSEDHGGNPKYRESEVTAVVVANRTLYAYFVPDTHAIYEWEGREKNKMMTWRSKIYVSQKPFNPSAIRVDATDSRGRGTAVNRVEVAMMSSPDATDANPTILGNMPNYVARRLPHKRPERYLQVEVQNDAEVDRIIVGTSMEGLAV